MNKTSLRSTKVLTIVVPAFNIEKYIEQCISSVISSAEIRSKVEVIIVNDGSTDGTGEIAEKYKKDYPDCIRVINKENGGHGSAINCGIAEAEGKYFRVLDGDDWVDTRECESYVRKLERITCDVVVTGYTIVTERNSLTQTLTQRTEMPKLHFGKPCSFGEICSFSYIRMHEMTIRTELLQRHMIRLRENSFYVDMEYILFPVPYIQTICALPEYVYQYRMGNTAQSVSTENMLKNRKQHEAVLEDLLQYYTVQEKSGAARSVLNYLAGGIARMQANQIRIYLSYPTSKCWKQEIIKLEKRIRREYPRIYKRMKKKSIWLLRVCGYVLYPEASALLRRNIRR